MQSQLEATLLGQGVGGGSGVCSATVDEDERDEPEDDGDENDEYIDEEYEHDHGQKSGKILSSNALSKTVTLQMLLAADILQPGNGAMTIEYLGQKFVGDLLEDGKIRSQETDIVFASPSAWAIACKRFINPDKKSGCGWASVKYKGRKLDAYKNIWFKKKKDEIIKSQLKEEQEEEFIKENKRMIANSSPHNIHVQVQRIVVKHNTIANRTFTHDANTLIECVPFSNLGKIQPFLLSISTNAALLMDYHCHLTKSEVSGYLVGQWDVNAHSLQITDVYPCRNTKSDRENASQVEAEIAKAIDKSQQVLVGWYHSHPFSPAAPSLRDIDAQLDYQIKMKGLHDSSYTPCVGIIISSYNYDNTSLESGIIAYWVIPPPENKPNEYGRPMLMSYSVSQDTSLGSNIKDEMRKCVDYYTKQNEIIKFTDTYINGTTFIDKLKSTLISKFPQDQGDGNLWVYIRELLGCPIGNDSLLTIPTVTKNLPALSTPPPPPLPSSLNSNLMLTSDIANVLFNSGKFPSASSLLGLPDPMAHSTLAANNMFLSTTNLFKMQDLLKPMSTSSPIKPPKSETKTSSSTTLKIPSDLKKLSSEINLLSYKTPEHTDNMNKKPKLDYSALNLSDTTSDLSISTKLKHDISLSSISDLSTDLSQKDDNKSKTSKHDYSSLDLGSYSIKSLSEFASLAANLSNASNSDQPMNLTSNN